MVLNGTTTLGPTTFSGNVGSSSADFNLSFPLAAELDRTDVTSVAVTIKFKQTVGLAYTSLDNPASFISIPAWSSSFTRRVDVSLDDPEFGDVTEAALSDDLRSYTAQLPIYPFTSLGAHTVYARSFQGEAGPARSVAINVVE